MLTAVVSDLHLGAAGGRDLLRHQHVLGRLIDGMSGVDELVLLGDVVELRERRLDEVMAVAAPILHEIGRAMAAGRITILAGNHDHQLAAPLTDRRPLALDAQAGPPHPDDHSPLGRVARALGTAGPELRVAYPGVWLRDDVYATHGHYLDVHNTVPSLERLATGAIQRVTSRVPAGRATPDDYEAALAPVYALLYSLAQAAPAGRQVVHSDRSARMREALAGVGPRPLRMRLAAKVALPAVVRALNAAGLGPLRPELTGTALRRAALTGMRIAIERLGVAAPHVIFGHTHRSGPHANDDRREWGPLLNTGSWIHEPSFLGADPRASPYFPGHCAYVTSEAGSPPQLRRLLDELPGPATGTSRGPDARTTPAAPAR